MSKFKNRFVWLSTYFLMFAALFSISLKSQDLKGTELAENKWKFEEPMNSLDFIFIGKFENLGVIELNATGYMTCAHVKILVNQNLRGTFNSVHDIDLQIPYFAYEGLPPTKTEYVFFIKKKENRERPFYRLIKLLPATDDNIAKVKALIAAAPAGK